MPGLQPGWKKFWNKYSLLRLLGRTKSGAKTIRSPEAVMNVMMTNWIRLLGKQRSTRNLFHFQMIQLIKSTMAPGLDTIIGSSQLQLITQMWAPFNSKYLKLDYNHSLDVASGIGTCSRGTVKAGDRSSKLDERPKELPSLLNFFLVLVRKRQSRSRKVPLIAISEVWKILSWNHYTGQSSWSSSNSFAIDEPTLQMTFSGQ